MPIQLKSRSGSTYITEQQYSIVKQPYRELFCKVNLLNYQFQVVDEISGVVISDSWTISATSDIRRTGTLVITTRLNPISLVIIGCNN